MYIPLLVKRSSKVTKGQSTKYQQEQVAEVTCSCCVEILIVLLPGSSRKMIP